MRPMAYIRTGRHNHPPRVSLRQALLYLAAGAGIGGVVTALTLQMIHDTAVRWCA